MLVGYDFAKNLKKIYFAFGNANKMSKLECSSRRETRKDAKLRVHWRQPVTHPPRCARCVIRRCKQQNRSIKSARHQEKWRQGRKCGGAALQGIRLSLFLFIPQPHKDCSSIFHCFQRHAVITHTLTHSYRHTYPPIPKPKPPGSSFSLRLEWCLMRAPTVHTIRSGVSERAARWEIIHAHSLARSAPRL